MKKTACILLLLGVLAAALPARQPVTRAELLAALSGNPYLGTSADGKLAWLQKSSGTVEPVGGCSITLVIFDLPARKTLTYLKLMTPGMMEPAAIPAADLDRALALLQKHRILAGGIEPLTLPSRIHGALYAIRAGNDDITLLCNNTAIRSININDNRPDPFTVTGTLLIADKRFLVVEYHRGEGTSYAGIAEREWYYNMVVFELPR